MSSERTHFSSTLSETILWSQLPTGLGYCLQHFPDLYPEYDSGVAGDFQFNSYEFPIIVCWWGDYWNGSVPLPIDAAFEVYI
jgi:hypothetical protein